MNISTEALQTSLQRANCAFRKGDFAAAIDLYEKAAVDVPILADSLQLNIQLASSRLALAEDHSVGQKQESISKAADSRLTLTKPDSLEEYYFTRIVESELFDAAHYLKNYQNQLEGVDNLLAHYLKHGVAMSLNPSAHFDTAYYLKSHPDVAQAGVNPFIHYVCNGRAEGRDAVPKPYISKYSVAPVEYIPRLPVDMKPVTKAVRAICFYLPQFHAIPENDKWWGKGFTEWTNVIPAVPQFEGHYQPHVPHDDIGYYNLLSRDAQAKQIELAKQYGIEGFCYYLYWFSGQRLLEQPLDNMLNDPTLDLPFCVCWANENWSRRWDGLDQDLLMVQNYSDEDDIAFISNIVKYLRDPRYITVDGKPLLLVYRPNLFPDMKATTKRWRDWCRDNGIGEIYLAYPQSFECVDPAEYDFDAAIEFPPNNSKPPNVTNSVEPVVGDFQATVYDWRALVDRSDDYIDPGYKLFRSATPSWDNTARKKKKGTVFHNSCPNLFKKYLTNAFSETLHQRDNPEERIVFINAWNEWAEGAHLEPDQKYGYAWLQAVYDAHEIAVKERKKIVIVSHDAHPHGAQILCLNFAMEFSQKLHFDVDMVVLGEGRLIPKFQQYAKVHTLDLAQTEPEHVKRLVESLRHQGAEVALVNTTVSGNITPYLKMAGFKVVSLIHELPSVLHGYNLQQQAQAIAAHADKVVFPAHQVQHGFESFIGKSLPQAEIRPQGIYLPSILRKGVSKVTVAEQVRAKLGVASNAKIIVGAGYADHRKGFDYFVQSSMQVMQQLSNVYALWVGHLDTVFVEKSLQLATQAGLKDKFIFTGLVEDPREYYAAADVYALTSREDPFPSVVMEALDALTPVVAFKDCGGFENLLQRDCGVLVAKDDVSAFSQGILTLLNQPKQANELATNGKEIVEQELSFYHYLYDLLDFAGSPIPKVSVAVPNYNYAKYIVERLNSITQQSFPLYELIVLDDVSKDNSIDLIQEFLQKCKIPHRLVINEHNSGSVFKQWQRAAEIAHGDYLWIAEADDLAEPKFVEKLIAFFDDPDVVLAYSQSKQIDQDGALLADDYLSYTSDIGDHWGQDYVLSGEEEIKRALCIKNTIPNVSGVLLKRSAFIDALKQASTKLPNFKVAGDWLIYMEIIKGAKIAFTPESLNLHRRHTGSVTKINNHFDEVRYLQKRAGNYCSIPSTSRVKMAEYSNFLENYFIESLPKSFSKILEDDIGYYSSHCDTSVLNVGDASVCERSIVGKDGWLFIYKGSNDYVGSYLNEPMVDLANQWKQLFEVRSQRMNDRSISFAQIIIPNKATILSDFLPDVFMGKEITFTLDSILNQNNNSDVLIPLSEMKDIRVRKSVYRRSDSHLTIAGSALLSELLLKKFNLQNLNIEKVKTKVMKHAGDLGTKFEESISEVLHVPILDDGLLNQSKLKLIDDVIASGFNGSRQVFINESSVTDKKLIVFGNSFFEKIPGWGMSPIFAAIFREFHFVWSPELDYSYVDSHHPDFVICQTCERFLTKVPLN